MIPENSLKQLHKLRKETKGKDIGDLTAHIGEVNLPNSTYIGNTVDKKVDSYEEFTRKDNELQTVAFKSKLVNKPLIKENKKENMKNKLNNILSISDFEKNWKPEDAKKTKRTEVAKDVLKEYHTPGYEPTPIELSDDADIEFIKRKQIEKKIKDRSKIEKDDEITESSEPKYEILGKEKEEKGGFPYGYAQERDLQIKKISQFNLIDPSTPKERPVLNAGQFIDNDKVKGYVNRIEGKDVYVESLEEPMVIKKFSLKDAVKIKKQDK